MKKLIPVFAILAYATLACCGTPGSPCVSGGSGSVPTSGGQQGNILFFDDFSTDSGWSVTYPEDGSFAGYDQGGYRILVMTDYFDIIGRANQSLPADVIIDVDATKIGGEDDSSNFGVVCRMQDLDNLYFFTIAPDGFASIGMYQDGSLTFLNEPDYMPDYVNPGANGNHIRAECIGSTLALYANGNLMVQVTDTTFPSGGDVGLIAGTYGVTGTNILFDNFYVQQP